MPHDVQMFEETWQQMKLREAVEHLHESKRSSAEAALPAIREAIARQVAYVERGFSAMGREARITRQEMVASLATVRDDVVRAIEQGSTDMIQALGFFGSVLEQRLASVEQRLVSIVVELRETNSILSRIEPGILQPATTAANELVTKGKGFLRSPQEKFRQLGLQCLREALEIDRASYSAALELARAHGSRGEAALQDEFYELAFACLNGYPDGRAAVLHEWGLCLMARDELPSARARLKEAASLGWSPARAYDAAAASLRQGKGDEGIADLRAAVEATPGLLDKALREELFAPAQRDVIELLEELIVPARSAAEARWSEVEAVLAARDRLPRAPESSFTPAVLQRPPLGGSTYSDYLQMPAAMGKDLERAWRDVEALAREYRRALVAAHASRQAPWQSIRQEIADSEKKALEQAKVWTSAAQADGRSIASKGGCAGCATGFAIFLFFGFLADQAHNYQVLAPIGLVLGIIAVFLVSNAVRAHGTSLERSAVAPHSSPDDARRLRQVERRMADLSTDFARDDAAMSAIERAASQRALDPVGSPWPSIPDDQATQQAHARGLGSTPPDAGVGWGF